MTHVGVSLLQQKQAATEMSKQPLSKNSQTGIQELNKPLFFSFYYQQTLVAILHEANYTPKPYRLYSAPGILFPLYSLVTFYISERRSRDDNLRDTRPGC